MSEARLDISEGSLKALVESLAADDDFRAWASRDPSAALAEFGIHVSARDLPGPIPLAPHWYFQSLLRYLEHGPPVASFFQVLAALFSGPAPSRGGPAGRVPPGKVPPGKVPAWRGPAWQIPYWPLR